MAEMMTTMRGMFEQLSQEMRDIRTSQVAKKCYLGKHYFCNALLCDINTMPLIYFRVAILDGNDENETVNLEVKKNFSKNFSKNSSLHIYIPCYDGYTMNLSSLLVNMS